jgi:hypothetical protein
MSFVCYVSWIFWDTVIASNCLYVFFAIATETKAFWRLSHTDPKKKQQPNEIVGNSRKAEIE